MKSRAMYLYDHFNPILLIAVCFMVFYLYSNGIFSAPKVVDGIDTDGNKYVDKVVCVIYPTNQAQLDSMLNLINNSSHLTNSRYMVVNKTLLKDQDSEVEGIYIEVSCENGTKTQNFINTVKLLSPRKMVLKLHRCKNNDLTDDKNISCEEKPEDIYTEENP